MELFFLRPEDLPAMERLFYDTVHTVCAADYSAAELDAWASGESPGWDLCSGTALGAEVDGLLLGFGLILPDGYLDLLFVHRDYQGRGVASALCAGLERRYPVRQVTVRASKTARPFFEKRGYRLIQANRTERRGQILLNYTMRKELIS